MKPVVGKNEGKPALTVRLPPRRGLRAKRIRRGRGRGRYRLDSINEVVDAARLCFGGGPNVPGGVEIEVRRELSRQGP